jgi:hypothetical protein
MSSGFSPGSLTTEAMADFEPLNMYVLVCGGCMGGRGANLSPWVAFMRWHWCGDTEWAPKFMMGGEYCTAPWTCQSKNL